MTADAKVIQYFKSNILFQTVTAIFIIINCVLIWAAFVIELQIRTHGLISKNTKDGSTIRRKHDKKRIDVEEGQEASSPVASTTLADIEDNGRQTNEELSSHINGQTTTQVMIESEKDVDPIPIPKEGDLQEEDEETTEEDNTTKRLIPPPAWSIHYLELLSGLIQTTAWHKTWTHFEDDNDIFIYKERGYIIIWFSYQREVMSRLNEL